MSHIVSIAARVNDTAAVAAACKRLGLAEPVQGTAELYSSKASGLIVQLRGWNYPIVIDTGTGELRYDNFSGRWGDDGQMHLFLQAYAVERAKMEARKQGYAVSEQVLQGGAIKVQIIQGGQT